ncbi:WD40 repeat-like protein [Tieghemiomyces parasiticus]|uniref:WD40 repeat-like protein n=1 Tax=Tieghemiomyces parasiticus TaxID=78921 RepID=A0A9W8DN89_9FUNG|nr:WD40 repeat-like protein [Tieghemiomyces parasiticus]
MQEYLFAPNPPTTRGQAVKLSADPKGEQLVYANGKSIFIRNLSNPTIATEYVGHRARTTVARFAPSGYYVASGDASGTVRVWDATQEENLLKNETAVSSGEIRDLAWDAESKRLMAVGDGKDRFGHVFLFDTGNSVGEVTGHSRVINACTMRPSGRPFRAATASDDGTVVFYHGAPYRLQTSIRDHAGFVNDVRYAPNGDLFASVGADKKVGHDKRATSWKQKIFLYDGKTGEKLAAMGGGDTGHTGSIYALAWSPDSRQFLTSAGDSTVKLWDAQTQQLVSSLTFDQYGSYLDQQVGNLWAGEHVVTLGQSGDLFYLDPRTEAVRTVRTLHGHQKAITASALTEDQTLYTGSYDGRVCSWQFDADLAGTPQLVTGNGHPSQIMSIASRGKTVVTAGMDDVVRGVSALTRQFESMTVSLDSQPRQLDVLADGSTLEIGQTNEVLLLSASGEVKQRFPVDHRPTAIHATVRGDRVVVGFENHQCIIYDFDGLGLKPTQTLKNNRSAITAVRFSPDGSLVAAADGLGKILVYDPASGEVKISQWVFHTAKVNGIEWRADGLFLASSSLDSNVYVYSVEKPMKRITIKGAHLGGVTSVHFLDDQHLLTTGSNGSVRVWSLTYPE